MLVGFESISLYPAKTKVTLSYDFVQLFIVYGPFDVVPHCVVRGKRVWVAVLAQQAPISKVPLLRTVMGSENN